MPHITETPIAAGMLGNIRNCAVEGMQLLGLPTKPAPTPDAVVEAIDAFVYAWQKGTRPPADVLDPEDAPFVLGSLWGEQIAKRFGWTWAMITFHDHGDSKAPGVCSPDRGLVIYPIHFLLGCLQDPDVDATVALSFNMLAAGKVGPVEPLGYLNLMEGVQRIVPRG
jgi:hypothetical protein